MIKEFGFIEPKIGEDHYILGASEVPQKSLVLNSDWRTVWGPVESQDLPFETYNCTSFNTLRSLSRLVFLLTGEKVTYSDRFLGIVAGTKPPGNDPHTVCEAIRKYGVIPESMLPMDGSIQNVADYYSFKGGNEGACYIAGEQWLKRFKFLHEWVFKGDESPDEKIKRMISILPCSPLGVSVDAWLKNNGVYVSTRSPNHWTEEVSLEALNDWIINDSYPDETGSYEKKLDWLFTFKFCKRYHLELLPVEKKVTFWEQITIIIKSLCSNF